MEHCCELMNDFLDENKVAIGYSLRFRAYYIDLKGSSGTQCIKYCPWCSNKLPNTLYDEYDKELSNFLHIKKEDITYDTYLRKDLPLEFKTDEWWKKRGL